MFAYTVSCTFDDPAVAQRWIDWLAREHLREVCEAGAIDAEVVRSDGAAIRCEVRYRFPDREAFERYERDHAPRLRAEGLRLFPLELGLRYERSTGEVVAGHPRPGH